MSKPSSQKAQHWNGNVVCAIDIESTGPDPLVYEIVQLAILPLDGSYRPRKDICPLYINILPDNPQVADPKYIKKKKYLKIATSGFTQEAAQEILYTWIQKLNLPQTKWGTPKRIYPLGHNYCHDRDFLIHWLGMENYDEFFGPRVLDTMTTALYLNDQASFHGNQVPYSKVDLSWLAKQHNVSIFGRHDALIDCKITAEVYRNMCKTGIF
jgi:hypothetical protein